MSGQYFTINLGPNSIAEGRYWVDGDALTVTVDGGPAIQHKLKAGESALLIAKALLRKSAQRTEFDRALHYPTAGVA